MVGQHGRMTDFGGGTGSFTTWDGEPVSRDRPRGATVVVASRAPDGWKYLILHRAHRGPTWDGDWAWTPPTGSRKPGEDITACAARELYEETGLCASPRAVATVDIDWAVFVLEVRWSTPVVVDGTEHDRCEWVAFAEACRRCRPDVVADTLRTAAGALGIT